MRYQYITIEREYGSGGTKIGRQLSGELGIPCYGREIIEIVSENNQISVDKIERYEEAATNSLLYTIYMMGQIQSGNGNVLSQEGAVYLEEQKTIKKLADEGSAVFLGHCASEALKNRTGVLKVFIHADVEEKKKRIQKDYGIGPDQMEATIKRFNKKRANYYYANTGRKWDNLRAYDVVLDSGRLGVEGCVTLLKSMMR